MRGLATVGLVLAIGLAGCWEACGQGLSAAWYEEDQTLYDIIRTRPTSVNQAPLSPMAVERQDHDLGILALQRGTWAPADGTGLRFLLLHAHGISSSYDGAKTNTMDQKAIEAAMEALAPFTTDASKIRRIVERAVDQGNTYPECWTGQSIPNCNQVTEWRTPVEPWNAEELGLDLDAVVSSLEVNTSRLQATEGSWTFKFGAGAWSYTANTGTITVHERTRISFQGLYDDSIDSPDDYEFRVRAWLIEEGFPEPDWVEIQYPLCSGL